eukprot:tig00000912_g5431.t1
MLQSAFQSLRRFFSRADEAPLAAPADPSSTSDPRMGTAMSTWAAPDAERNRPRPSSATPKRTSLASILWGGPQTQQQPSDPSSSGRASGDGGRLLAAFAERQGRRKDMQDVSVLRPLLVSLGNSREVSMFALFDGHGGRTAADLASTTLPDVLAQKLKNLPIAKALREAYIDTNSAIAKAGITDGTCALAVLIVSSPCEMLMYCANAGDSEAVLCRGGKPKLVSIAHRPKNPQEITRIISGGGFVTARGRVNGILAVSRALGDIPLQPHVSPEPEITETKLVGDEILIMGCDGIWDVLSKESGLSIVKSEISNTNEIDRVERAACALRDKAFSAGSTDNLSVIVVRESMRSA